MIIQSKQNRTFVMTALLASVPDLIIAAIVTAVIVDERDLFFEGVLVFVGVIVGLQLLYFALWIKNSLWLWAMFVLRDKKVMTQSFVDSLSEGNFPQPSEYLADSMSYFGMVAEDDSIDIGTRLKAAREVGAIEAIQSLTRFQYLMTISIALEEAIEEYNRLCLSKS